MYFPTGLQVLPAPKPDSSMSGGLGDDEATTATPSLLVSYGKDDSRAMTMTLSGKAVREFLKPIDSLEPEKYKFCTVGRAAAA